MKTLRLAFQDFWGTFDQNDNIFIWILSHKYNIVLDYVNPEFVISGGVIKKFPNARYIYWSSEPWYPTDKSFFDFGMSGFHFGEDAYLRFPLYLYYIYEYKKRGFIGFDFFEKNRKDELESKDKFCIFIARGWHGRRAEFVKKLMKYKSVDVSFGPCKNVLVPGEAGTIEGSLSKINFIKEYKFVVAYENCSLSEGFNGYTTEKLIEPMIANCLPLYWGNNKIHIDFNTKTFMNCHEFESEEKFIERIIEVDNNDELYREYFREHLKNIDNRMINNDGLPKVFFEKVKI